MITRIPSYLLTGFCFPVAWWPWLQQACHRVYRFGQRRPVCIYRLVCASTLEASMSNRQAFKLALAQRVLDNREMEGLLPNAAMHR